MNARNLLKVLREPLWFVLIAALVAGAILGIELVHEQTNEAAQVVFGRAWKGDPGETRAVLGTIFGFEITIVALLLSLNGMVIKSAAYQYSTRLVPLYVQHAPIRRALPWFVLLAAYLLASVREIGLVANEDVRPRPVVSVAVILVAIALAFLIVDLFRTFRFVRVERVLGLVRDSTYAAAKRVRRRVARLPLDASAVLELPVDASALVARESGYLVDVRVRQLARLAEKARVRARVSHPIGHYVDEGDVIGWASADDGRPLDPNVARKLAATLVINPVRELDYDPALGVRIIVDVADRALSSSSNDPYTARQALNQLRSVLRHVGRLPLGDWNVVDRDRRVRVSVKGTHLRELLSLAVKGPLYYGGNDPDVLEGLLEIVLEAWRVARNAADRSAARTLFEHIDRLAGAELDPARLDRLRAEAEPVRRQETHESSA
jgi:uncharacterized membrane protein